MMNPRVCWPKQSMAAAEMAGGMGEAAETAVKPAFGAQWYPVYFLSCSR